ncbi:hypothetical protein AD17_5333 [Escherichia coli 3-373-03_S4_C2]|nr:hypothetical protein AD17_5333 [Escherichia coli 3-373-03_S4_C2]
MNRLLLMWILCLLQKRISLKPVGLTMVFFCPGMTSCEQKKNLKEWLSHSEIALVGRKDSDLFNKAVDKSHSINNNLMLV